MLVDVVTFSGENDLLKARLDILQPDVCVVVESDKYFQGQPKPYLMDVSAPQIVYVQHEASDSHDAWENEFQLRRAGLSALKALDVPADAVVGLFDVDEIPDRDVILQTSTVTAWNMAKFQMSLYWYQRHELTGVSALYGDVWQSDAARIRQLRNQHVSVTAGWHFSSLMSVDAMVKKWEGFAHTELRRPNMREWVEHCVANGLAIESGDWLEEQEFPMVPERMFSGPSFWRRKRNA